jgi:hypothetical protein
MNKRKNIFANKHLVSSVFMILALMWLTISLPFVYADQQHQKEIKQSLNLESAEEECNPFANTTEEKTEGGANTLSEYLHELHNGDHLSITLTKYFKCHPSDLYFAYDPELISPPPEA